MANIEEVHKIFKLDSVEKIMYRLETAKTDFASKTMKTLKRMSPLALAVTFEQIKRGQKMTLHDCFVMEFKMTQGFIEHGELLEGVRALLVDKDKKPKWAHKSVAWVKPEEVEWFFTRPHTFNLDLDKYK